MASKEKPRAQSKGRSLLGRCLTTLTLLQAFYGTAIAQDGAIADTTDIAEEVVIVTKEYVKPHILEMTGGGKMILRFEEQMYFPENMCDALNDEATKDQYLVMQITSAGEAPPSLPEPIPSYPVDPEQASTVIDPNTGEMLPIET